MFVIYTVIDPAESAGDADWWGIWVVAGIVSMWQIESCDDAPNGRIHRIWVDIHLNQFGQDWSLYPDVKFRLINDNFGCPSGPTRVTGPGSRVYSDPGET